MRKLIICGALLLAINTLTAQTTLPDFDKHPVKNAKQATAENDTALQTANYLLTHPVDEDELNRLNSASYLIKWMEASPDYLFSFDSNFGIVSGNTELAGIYVAAMAKYQIENNLKEVGEDNYKIWEIFAQYAGDPKNNVKVKGKVKKLVAAYNEDTLKEYLE